MLPPLATGETSNVRLNIKQMTFGEVRDNLLRQEVVDGASRLPAQLYEAVHRDSRSLDELHGIKKDRVRRCQEIFESPALRLRSVHRSDLDASARYVFDLEDGNRVESVLLHHHGLWTVCVSSQAGCPLACRFCATGMLGLARDLRAWEIVDQVLQVAREAKVRVSDVVFMGMGEPLLNEEAVYRAATVLNQTHGCQISHRRINLSTSGVVPAIHRFIDERRPFRLLFSLCSADPEKRRRLMPLQERWGFETFLDAVRRYEHYRRHKHVTLAYVAIKNLTMGDDDVEAIAHNLTGFKYILNVIPLNPVGTDLEAPAMEEVLEWTRKLRPLKIPVKIRYSGGQDQWAGCGQLGRTLLESGRTT